MWQQPFSCFDWFDFHLIEVYPRAIYHSNTILLHNFCILFGNNFCCSRGQYNTLKFLLYGDRLQQPVSFQYHSWTFLRITLIKIPHRQWNLHLYLLLVFFLRTLRILLRHDVWVELLISYFIFIFFRHFIIITINRYIFK